MTTFLQYHFLTSYAASNLNRDDAGRPKTLTYGEANRLRVSSQSLKRAWRTSDVFAETMQDHLGTRSNRFAEELFALLTVTHQVEPREAAERIRDFFGQKGEGFGAFEKLPDKKKDEEIEPKHVRTKQLVHLGPNETEAISGLAETLAGETPSHTGELAILTQDHGAVDIALFGRMLADQTRMNVEAACQVAHAFTTHRVAVEDDFYTAVDDLKNKAGGDDAGAGFVGVHDYGAGVFYAYVCLNADQLAANLSGETTLGGEAAAVLAKAMATVGPTGKQNSYASRARAGYGLLEVGDTAPRSLAEAFLKPVRTTGGENLLGASVRELEETKKRIASVYGDAPDKEARFDTTKGEGTLDDVLALTRKTFAELS